VQMNAMKQDSTCRFVISFGFFSFAS